MGVIGKVLVYGDIHLSSKNYGAHKDYPRESLGFFKNITKTAEELGVTHIIGLGDFTYGRFSTLEYRGEVEEELNKQNEICKGERYELKGNHDSATYGMTEYEYYIKKGLIKGSRNISIGKLDISMIDYGLHRRVKIIEPREGRVSVVLMHDFFKFEDTNIGDYGKSYILDNLDIWYGVDYIIGGHIHNHEVFSGRIIKDGVAKETVVNYLGCPCRPSYRAGHMQDTGQYAILTVYDDGKVDYDIHEFKLGNIEDVFNIGAKEERDKLHNQKHVDVSDIVKRLDNHKRVIGEPEDIIMAMGGIDIRYRRKAIELLKESQG